MLITEEWAFQEITETSHVYNYNCSAIIYGFDVTACDDREVFFTEKLFHRLLEGDKEPTGREQASRQANQCDQEDQDGRHDQSELIEPTAVDEAVRPTDDHVHLQNSSTRSWSPGSDATPSEANDDRPSCKRPRLAQSEAVTENACQCEHFQTVIRNLKREIRQQRQQYEGEVTR